MRKASFVVVLLILTLNMLSGQDKYFKREFITAEYEMISGNYLAALSHYGNLLSTDPENSNLNFLCGFCLIHSGGDSDRTISLLTKASKHVSADYKVGSYKERNAPMDALYQLGRTYHKQNEFNKAIEAYTNYSKGLDQNDFAEVEYANAHIKACELGMSMVSNPVELVVQPLGPQIGIDEPVLRALVSGNDSIIVLLSEQKDRSNIMVSVRKGDAWTRPLIINPQLAISGNIQPVSLSFDGKELYLVFDDYNNKDLFVSHYENNRWTRAKPLNRQINTKYSETHACTSMDGKQLFFTSDRKGGIGGLDIYMAHRIEGDEWGEPVNLGHSVNTYYNEETPFITGNDSRLYFSSQGHQTMGGYDIFFADRSSENSWDPPKNVGYPVNTSSDDLFFNPGWKEIPALYAMDTEDNEITFSVFEVTIADMISRITARTNIARDEALKHNKPGSEEEAPAKDMPNPEEEALAQDQPNPEEKISKPKSSISSLGMYYVLNSIHFEYDQSELSRDALRDVERIFLLLRKYPEIGVELTGHTDARGSRKYNLRLSNLRAKSVKEYLVHNGITEERITVMAAGEENPVAINQYEDGSDAPEGRKLNRHVSVKINNLSSDKIRVADIFVPDNLIPKQDKGYSVMLFESSGRVGTTPEELLGQEVSVISTKNSYLYSAGQFENKNEAVSYLNEVIDEGYPDARIIERSKLEHLIAKQSSADPSKADSYTIQIMALKRARDAGYFKKLTDVKRYECKDGLYRFTTGEYSRIEDAIKALPAVKSKGYRKAIIVSCSRYIGLVADH